MITSLSLKIHGLCALDEALSRKPSPSHRRLTPPITPQDETPPHTCCAPQDETLPRTPSRDLAGHPVLEQRPLIAATLEAGDLLYFPRGFVHFAR